MTQTYALASVGVVALLLGGTGAAILLGGEEGELFAECREGVVAGGGGSIGGPFTLVNELGETVTDQDVITRPTLVYFGYTFCPDVCPLDAVRNAEAADFLEAEGVDIQTVFITVDPNRDTPEVLDAFTANIHEDMIGLTGTQDQTHAAAQAYRVYYNSHDNGSDPYYLVDHTAFTYLMMPEHGFVEFFPHETAPQDMATRTACFVDAAA